jgi:hypothetical protein
VLNKFGIELLGPAPAVHPVTLGVFNFAEAFIFMLLPLMLMTRKGRDLPTVKAWSVAMFLTNALMLPYLGARAGQPASVEWARAKADGTAEGIAEVARGEKGPSPRRSGSPASASASCLCTGRCSRTRRSGGDLAQRFSYLGTLVTEDRVSWRSWWTSRCSRCGRRGSSGRLTRGARGVQVRAVLGPRRVAHAVRRRRGGGNLG